LNLKVSLKFELKMTVNVTVMRIIENKSQNLHSLATMQQKSPKLKIVRVKFLGIIGVIAI